MKLRKKIICSVVMLSLLIGLAILFLCPQIIATRYGYFDASNGKSKVECVSLGRIYQQSVQETEYSKLLIKFGFPETSPDWKLATQEEMGINRLYKAQNVDYYMGKIEADCKVFALTIESEIPDQVKARDLTEHLRSLIQKGDSSEVRAFVNLLQQGK